MIKGVHAMFYTTHPEEVRAFIRDKMEFDFTDVGDGWLIFAPPEGDIGCHPAKSNSHDISFYCDNLEETVASMKAKGVEFIREIRDDGFGFTTEFLFPDGSHIQLYQPKYDK